MVKPAVLRHDGRAGRRGRSVHPSMNPAYHDVGGVGVGVAQGWAAERQDFFSKSQD